MTRYAIRRGLTVVPVLVGVSLLVFSFVHLIPGDPALTMLGERATPEKVTEVRARLGLDRPLWEQYLLYVRKVVHGDLGVSIVRGDPVATDLWRRFPATVELAGAALVLATLVGVPLGMLCAVRRNSLIDSLARVGALTGVSMPIFWLGLVLAWIFGVQLGLLPTGFRLDSDTTLRPVTNFVILDALLQRDWPALRDALRHLVLPAIALATIPLAVITRMTRASLLEELTRDYIRTARAKGLSQLAVIVRHGLRNALLPVLTVIGLQMGRLLAGAILTETIFSWPGIGLWVYESIESRDYAIVQGATLFIAVIVVVVNLATDLLYAVVDPRIKYSSRRGLGGRRADGHRRRRDGQCSGGAAPQRRSRRRGVAPAHRQPGGARRARHRGGLRADGGADAARPRLRRQDRFQPDAAAQAADARAPVRDGHAGP